ncbi:MAG: alpha/beta hydrolase-fold protein [Anaerolineaceae bacterium]|jgi:esterase/lipase superfamily enzyme
MNVEYHKYWSACLGQDMELKVYGHSGKPVLVFPAMGGRFFEFEDFGMTEAVGGFIEEDQFQFFTVDSVDRQSWANWGAPPAARARRHEDYDRYIVQEVTPFIRQRCGAEALLLSTGVSMGGYHSANFFFRHPDIFDCLVSLSGIFQLRMFIGDYLDENVYYNSPLLYLPNLDDLWYLEKYRRSQIILCSGQGAWEDAMLNDIRSFSQVLERKQIPAWIDLWGEDVDHDWPWWRKQFPYFLSKLVESNFHLFPAISSSQHPSG